MTGAMPTTCPECGTTNDPQNAFCEVCGLHFATGEKPGPPPAPAPVDPAPSAETPSGNGDGRVRPPDPRPDRATMSFLVTERDPADVAATTPAPEAAHAPAPGVSTEGAGDPAAEATSEGATGAATEAPTGAAPDGASWIAVIEVDAAFFASNQTADHAGELALPPEVVERRVAMTGDDLLIGRRSASRHINPAIDLSVAPQDSGVSHRHATLSRRGDGWSVTDLGSTNGSWVAGDPEPLEPFVEQPIRPGDSLLIGAWTRITVRRVEEPADVAPGDRVDPDERDEPHDPDAPDAPDEVRGG